MNQTLKNQKPIIFNHKIGSTIYQIGVYLNEISKESLDDKIFRMMKNDLQKSHSCATMEMLQTVRLSRRIYANPLK